MVKKRGLFPHLCSSGLSRKQSDTFYFIIWVASLHIIPIAVGHVDGELDSEWFQGYI